MTVGQEKLNKLNNPNDTWWITARRDISIDDVDTASGLLLVRLVAATAAHGTTPPSQICTLSASGVLSALTPAHQVLHHPSWFATETGTHLLWVHEDSEQAKSTVIVAGLDGTDPQPCAHVDGFVDAMVPWSTAQVLLLVAEPGCYSQRDSSIAVPTGRNDDPAVHTPRTAWRRLVFVDVPSGTTRTVPLDGWSVLEVCVTDDQQVIAIAATDPSGSGWYHSSVVRIDPHTGEVIELYKPQQWYLEGLAVSPSGNTAAVIEGYCSDAGLLAGRVKLIDMRTLRVSDPWPHESAVTAVEFIDDNLIGFSGWWERGSRFGHLHIDSQMPGRTIELGRQELHLGPDIAKPAVHWMNERTCFTTAQSFTVAPEVVCVEDNVVRVLSNVNAAVTAGAPQLDVEALVWESEDGTSIDGWLLSPLGAGGVLPTVVVVHGGPTWAWGPFFSETLPNPQHLVSAGYRVFLPNQRGSNHRGATFAEAVIGDAGGADLVDLITGVEMLIDRGLSQRGSVGIAGLSYGGFMAGWAPIKTDLFGAAVAVSVVSDWPSCVLNSDAHDQSLTFLGDDVFGPDSLHRERSPAFHPQRCSTPTLIIAGALDRCTPVGQGEELYAKLCREGVPTQLVVYPREGHMLIEHDHVLDATARVQAWFDQYLPRL